MYRPGSRVARVAMLCLLQAPLAVLAELGARSPPVVRAARAYTHLVLRLVAYLDALCAGPSSAVCRR
jgi:hypothetical protein